MVFGKKGSGKSTLMVRLAYKYLAKGWSVFWTEKLDGCYWIDYKDIGYKNIPPNSLLLIDEVGMLYDNRNFKEFKPAVRDWFKLQRHYKVRVYMFSQSFDVDKKLRDLTDDMYLVKNIGRVFSYAKRILRKTVLVKPMGDSPSRIDEELRYDFLLFAPFGARMLTFIPKWAKYFDSHNCPVLPDANWRYVPPEKVPKSFRKLEKRKKRASRSSKCIHKFILLRSLFPRISLLLAGILKRKSWFPRLAFLSYFVALVIFAVFVGRVLVGARPLSFLVCLLGTPRVDRKRHWRRGLGMGPRPSSAGAWCAWRRPRL